MSRRTRRATRRGSRRRPVAWLPERSPDKDTLAHFERFCYSLRLPDDGGRFRLEDWQLAILEDYFAGVMESLWLLPTGQGKSTLLGALALHHGTYVRRNPRVFILGGLGGHGRNTLDAASAFIEESHDLSRWWVPQEYRMGRIKSLIDRQGEILVSSAGRRAGGRGGSAQEGSAPTLVLVEELHRHEDNGAAVRTLTSKIGKKSKGRHRVRIVHVTTAGDHFDSVLGRLVERATDVEAGCKVETSRRKGEHYRYARDADGDLVMHEWAVPDQISRPRRVPARRRWTPTCGRSSARTPRRSSRSRTCAAPTRPPAPSRGCSCDRTPTSGSPKTSPRSTRSAGWPATAARSCRSPPA
jgi:hypothetical protein